MVGLQILKRRRQVPAQLVQAFKGLPVANISDCMTRLTAALEDLESDHGVCNQGFVKGRK